MSSHPYRMGLEEDAEEVKEKQDEEKAHRVQAFDTAREVDIAPKGWMLSEPATLLQIVRDGDGKCACTKVVHDRVPC